MNRFAPLALGALAFGAAMSPSASAELRISGVWGGIFTGSSTTSITVEFDTETHRVDVFGGYRDLQSELTEFVLEYVDGTGTLMALDHDGGLMGFAHGSTFLDEPAALAIQQGGLQLRMVSLDPSLSGGTRAIHFDDAIHQQASQVHPSIPGAISTSFGFTNETDLFLNVSAQGFASDVTRVEFFQGAWLGETGTSVAEATHFAGGEWWTLQLTNISSELRRDYRDGVTYVEIEFGPSPTQVMRLQLHDDRLGTEHCMFNSTDQLFGGSHLGISGSPRIADGSLTLHGKWLPPNTFVIPLVARSNRHRTAIPFTSSVMCLGGGPVGRLASGVGMTTAGGVFEATLDPRAMPTPNGPVSALPGEQWNVTLWYRDVQDGGLVQSNFSSAVRLELR